MFFPVAMRLVDAVCPSTWSTLLLLNIEVERGPI